MASSTTMPMASTRPKSERLFSENPIAAITAKVPTSDTGTASRGMIDARQLWRNTSTTMTTSTTASKSVWITASMDCSMNAVGSYPTWYFMPGGNDLASWAICAFTAAAAVRALAPGSWKMAIPTDSWPLR